MDEGLIREHVSRLGQPYFSRFSEDDLCRHLIGLSRLSPDHPVEVLVDLERDGGITCTVLAFNYPFEFSIITGILAGMGYSIVSGDVFTYEKALDQSSTGGSRRRPGGGRIKRDPTKRRRIIDHFSGLLDTPLSFQDWAAELRKRMEEIISLLESGDEESVREAKHKVNEMVISRLARLQKGPQPALYPVKIYTDNESGPCTRLRVVSEDTPGFLYALSNALSLHNILIEHVRIRTIHGHVEDELDILDSQGRAIKDPDLLNQVKLCVLLTKQFTYFLAKAPDPFAALARFDHLVEDVLRLPGKGEWFSLLTNPRTLQDLARLLGASDFLWEDFIRLQYETLLPMLSSQVKAQGFATPMETLPERLTSALEGATSLEEQREKFNAFKDREIFFIDLDHILDPEIDFRTFAKRLTCLAENVVNVGANLVYNHLVTRYGTPRTVAGIEARYAVLGLGKLGGAALGYASDIEVLFVYSDNGRTDGAKSIENAEFFSILVKETAQFIRAKREGIFRVDLRLRPHGNSGPFACSLQSFCNYYGQGGQAHSYERLALVRLRAIGGDRTFGSQVERLRDEILYSSKNIDLKELRDLRERQFLEKTKGGRLNAKFSPGGLVDLEYGVQILQVTYGEEVPELKTPRLHEAMKALTDAGILSTEETQRLVGAYDFLRLLINGMRMLRGSAEDLFLPPVESDEFAHLARRMGYERGDPLDSAQQLRIDFETYTAAVRSFTERHFGRDSLPGPGIATISDLVLSDSMPRKLRREILSNARFQNPDRADVNFRSLAGEGGRRDTFAKLAVLATDILMRTADPDMALNNWERFIRSVGSPEFHYNVLLSQPMHLEILLSIFSTSQFLADTLVRNPGFLDWVIIPEILRKHRRREELEEELRKAAKGCRAHGEWLNKLRRLRRREILRVGIRDIVLGVSTREVMGELSDIAGAFTQVALERVWEKLSREEKVEGEVGRLKDHFCIMALGKLGGNELNYSSDIDLLGLRNGRAISDRQAGSDNNFPGELFPRVMERVRSDLSIHTEEGYAYRVDLRLRPFGSAGELVPTVSGLLDYYRDRASIWEIQAALKMRPVAGNLRLGHDFLEQMWPILLKPRSRESVVESIVKMRNDALKAQVNSLTSTVDVKSGIGGLRDVEFLVQGLQLIHAPNKPELIEGNTMMAIEALCEAGILPESTANQLKEDYTFLRHTEHYLQILEDRQIHTIPKDPKELNTLAKRILGIESNGEQFMEKLNGCLNRTRKAYVSCLLEGKG